MERLPPRDVGVRSLSVAIIRERAGISHWQQQGDVAHGRPHRSRHEHRSCPGNTIPPSAPS